MRPYGRIAQILEGSSNISATVKTFDGRLGPRGTLAFQVRHEREAMLEQAKAGANVV